MRVERKFLGNGIYRLELVPTNHFENVERLPRDVKDTVMRDAMYRMRNESCVSKPLCGETFVERPRRFSGCVEGIANPGDSWPCCRMHKDVFSPNKRSYSELRNLEGTREPDGIDVHVDRPLRENFWSHHDWALAMAKYRTLEDVAKDCDWECREPMKGAEMFYQSNLTPSCVEAFEDNDVWEDNWMADDSEWCHVCDDDYLYPEWSCMCGRY